MIRGIFIFLITCIIIAVAGFFVKEKLGFDAVENFDVDKITGTLTKERFDNSGKIIPKGDKKIDKVEKEEATDVYFLKTNGDKIKFSTEKKEIKSEKDKFITAMESLFSGPNSIQKISGVYSEIPPQTKLLGIKEDKNSYTINISDDFEYGGGADSMKVRVQQLVTTATEAADGKDVYLEINGKRAEYVGGEGIIILQPLQRNL